MPKNIIKLINYGRTDDKLGYNRTNLSRKSMNSSSSLSINKNKSYILISILLEKIIVIINKQSLVYNLK